MVSPAFAEQTDTVVGTLLPFTLQVISLDLTSVYASMSFRRMLYGAKNIRQDC